MSQRLYPSVVLGDKQWDIVLGALFAMSRKHTDALAKTIETQVRATRRQAAARSVGVAVDEGTTP